MKSELEIKNKIASLQIDIDDLNIARNEKKEAYGGISEEENNDFLSDICAKITQIDILNWALK